MKPNILKPILLIVFLCISYFTNAQLIDPMGKVKTHEIKLTKLKDGTRAGAMEWTTGGQDSLQKFIIKGLDVKAPVMVSIISKAPDHNIDLSFHKKGWDTMESKISTDGEKYATKTFRTMNSAGIGISSKVAGIPYLISVKVGLQFPSTNSLLKITDNKEEYTQHMRKLGYSGALFNESGLSTSSSSNETNNNSNGGNSLLSYIIIGLLSIIIILLVVFLLKKKSANKATLTLLLFSSAQFCIAQSNEPKEVPVDGQGDSPVFYDYQSRNVVWEEGVPGGDNWNSENIPVMGSENREVHIENSPTSVRLTPEQEAKVKELIEESNREFDDNYGEGSPGEDTEGTQRTLPNDVTQEELDQLRREVRRLQRQVDLLSRDDEQYEEDGEQEAEILIYCEQIEDCQTCIQKGFDDLGVHQAYLQYLQGFYASEINSITAQIARGNSIASIPGAGVGWGPILQNVVMPAVNNLKRAYSDKFDEYIAAMQADLNVIKACYTGEHDRFPAAGAYEAQVTALIISLKAQKINI